MCGRHCFLPEMIKAIIIVRIYRKIKSGVRIFENSFLEKFTKCNPRRAIIFYASMICSFLCLSVYYSRLTIWYTAGFYLAGLFAWTLIEYLLHRYVFHYNSYFPHAKKLPFILHEIHHEQTVDEKRLFISPVPGTIIALIVFGSWYLLIGEYAFAFMAGLSNGYLIYAFIHYKIHSKPANPLFHRPWAHHAKHHFKYPDKAFGVSSPLWDILLGTMPPKNPK